MPGPDCPISTCFHLVDEEQTARLGAALAPLLGPGDTVFPDVAWASLAAGGDQIAYREFAGAEHGTTGSDPEALDEIRDFTRQHTPALAG